MADAVHYAGFWRRLTAWLVDSALLLLVIVPLMYLLYGPAYFAQPRSFGAYFGVGDFLLKQVMPAVVVIYFWVKFCGTPGKRLLECVVVDAATRQPLRVRPAVIRYLGYFVSSLPLGLGFLWIAWDKRKQGFHDKLAKSVVLHVPEDESEKSLDQLMREVR